jgi:hypothetical protein
MWEAPPQRKNRIVDLAVFLRWETGPAPEAVAPPKGRPKHAAVEAVMKERLLSAEANNGRGEWCFTASGGWE